MKTNGSGVVPLTVGLPGDDLCGLYVGDPIPNSMQIVTPNLSNSNWAGSYHWPPAPDKVRITLAEYEALREAAKESKAVASALQKLRDRIEVEVKFP